MAAVVLIIYLDIQKVYGIKVIIYVYISGLVLLIVTNLGAFNKHQNSLISICPCEILN
jgi:hypothetical protein